MPKRIEWTPQARADLRRIERQAALGILENLADYVITGHGDVQRLTDVHPPNCGSEWATFVSDSTITAPTSRFFVSSTAKTPIGSPTAPEAPK